MYEAVSEEGLRNIARVTGCLAPCSYREYRFLGQPSESVTITHGILADSWPTLKYGLQGKGGHTNAALIWVSSKKGGGRIQSNPNVLRNFFVHNNFGSFVGPGGRAEKI